MSIKIQKVRNHNVNIGHIIGDSYHLILTVVIIVLVNTLRFYKAEIQLKLA